MNSRFEEAIHIIREEHEELNAIKTLLDICFNHYNKMAIDLAVAQSCLMYIGKVNDIQHKDSTIAHLCDYESIAKGIHHFVNNNPIDEEEDDG